MVGLFGTYSKDDFAALTNSEKLGEIGRFVSKCLLTASKKFLTIFDSSFIISDSDPEFPFCE